MAAAMTASYRSLCRAALAVSVAALLILVSSTTSPVEASNRSGRDGFSIDLISRDSPRSPFYNPSETHFGRLRNALRRSINRANRFTVAASSREAATSGGLTQVTVNNGEYLLNISIGTPPTEILGIADTGSDLIWTQCTPCSTCYKQNAPLFNPRRSSTYTPLACSSDACTSFDEAQCSSSQCQYRVQYGDRSYSVGILSTDTVTLGTTAGQPVFLPRTIFGCGYDNDGTFNENGSGIIGLGGGSYSAISQMDSLIGGKFSYCFLPIGTTGSSKMSFGAEAGVTGAGAVSTPMVSKSSSTFYYLTLEAISVGGQRVEYFGGSSSNSSKAVAEGNIIIDSGTTETILPVDFYQELEKAVTAVINLERVQDTEQVLPLCYRTRRNIYAPVIKAHFTGADVNLNPLNTFVRTADDIVCFAFTSSPTIAIYGNLAQMNFLVGYDLNARTVSFKPTDCSTL
ncbi:aspartic proteinase CDR1-like [Malania oleifera]|uniref:aspartic proteinase CDR1-like n=1 Tax=Malania oleifera TaxID=397392 RepID=UPI0025AE713A|nr:aspartic proteinase CDR1-like [Malania oleifera]